MKNLHRYCKRRALGKLYTISLKLNNLKDMVYDNCPKLPRASIMTSILLMEEHIAELRRVIKVYEK